MKYYIPKGHHVKRTKIFSTISKKKVRFYYTDQEFYRNVYLHSDHWKELRTRKLTINPLCENCGDDTMVEPHHINYKELYDVTLSDLRSLCRKCHNIVHIELKRQKLSQIHSLQKKLRRKERRRRKKQLQMGSKL